MATNEPTIPNVFIIESLTFDDENKKRFEGQILSNILNLNNIGSKYYYIRTKKEFLSVINIFNKSKYRYLHISCHGEQDGIHTTLDKINTQELGSLIQDAVLNKRLFFSV